MSLLKVFSPTNQRLLYFSLKTLKSIISIWGNIHESPCVNILQQNELLKRKTTAFMLKVSFFAPKTCAKSYSREVVLIIIHLINRLPSKVLGSKSLMDILSTFYSNMRSTNYLIPQTSECVFFIHVPSPNMGKLDWRIVKYIFYGIFLNLRRV